MKSLIRMYHDQGRGVVFYENAATPGRKRHATIEAVPLPLDLSETAPAYFKVIIISFHVIGRPVPLQRMSLQRVYLEYKIY